ncbi:hypothetical protein BVY04_00245 [bacterium M21]|nr:hypothetical protein BVY04_00245 [bacterium M21]
MKQSSRKTIEGQINTRLRQLGECSVSISGSFVRTSRKCGQKNCQCATPEGRKHPSCVLTSKVKGKTKAIYVPVDLAEEVEGWVNERKRIKRLLQEIDELAEELIRQHARTKQAVRKNKKRLL